MNIGGPKGPGMNVPEPSGPEMRPTGAPSGGGQPPATDSALAALAGVQAGPMNFQEALGMALENLKAIREKSKSVTGLIFSRFPTNPGHLENPVWYNTRLEYSGCCRGYSPIEDEVENDPTVDWKQIQNVIMRQGFPYNQREAFDAVLDLKGNLSLRESSKPTAYEFKNQKPTKKEVAMQRRAEALYNSLDFNSSPLREGNYQLKEGAPAWMGKVMDAALARVRAEQFQDKEISDEGEWHLRRSLCKAAGVIWIYSDDLPEKAAADHLFLKAIEGEDALAAWGRTSGEGVRAFIHAFGEDHPSYSAPEILQGAYLRFMDKVGQSLCDELRNGVGSTNPAILLGSDGLPEAFAWPGGYPLYYLTKDSGVLSVKSVRENLALTNDPHDPQWFVIGCEANFENPDLFCDDTGERIESAYAEDEANNFQDQRKATLEILKKVNAENPEITGFSFEALEGESDENAVQVAALYGEDHQVTIWDLAPNETTTTLLAETPRLKHLATEMLTPAMRGRSDVRLFDFQLEEDVEEEA